MPGQTLVNLALAVVTAELLHAISEMLSARFKAGQLLDWLQGRPARQLPINVDTRAKAYAMLITVAVVLTGVSFVVFTLLALSTTTAVVYVVVVVALTYAVSGIGMDGFHVMVGKVGQGIRSWRADR